MTTSSQWQLAREAAERYQSILTPVILGPFAQALVDFAAVQPNQRVLDIGCGTGAAARYASEIVGPAGQIIGIDINEGMIEVARSLTAVAGAAAVEWRVANATQLPLPERHVDVALCAQTLQFLPDKPTSLVEMRRVLKPGGRLALSLWCDISDNPYFAALVGAVARHIGSETAVGLQAAFALTGTSDIHTLLQEAGFAEIKMSVSQLHLPLPPLAEFVPHHISATPMAAGFSRATASVQARIVQEVVDSLPEYERNKIPFQSHMVLCHP